MTSTWALVVVSGIALAALIVYFSRHSRNKLFGTREDESLERLRTMSNTNVPLSKSTARLTTRRSAVRLPRT